jgi:hypothetical protein
MAPNSIPVLAETTSVSCQIDECRCCRPSPTHPPLVLYLLVSFKRLRDLFAERLQLMDGVCAVQVRKPSKEKDLPEDLAPCCFCSTGGRAYDLSCNACQNPVPFCIVTGKRMCLDDWTECPHCHFPASLVEMSTCVAASGKCPLCCQGVEAAALVSTSDPLRMYRSKEPLGNKGM